MILDIYLITVALGLVSCLIIAKAEKIDDKDHDFFAFVIIVSITPIINFLCFFLALLGFLEELGATKKIGQFLIRKIKW